MRGDEVAHAIEQRRRRGRDADGHGLVARRGALVRDPAAAVERGGPRQAPGCIHVDRRARRQNRDAVEVEQLRADRYGEHGLHRYPGHAEQSFLPFGAGPQFDCAQDFPHKRFQMRFQARRIDRNCRIPAR